MLKCFLTGKFPIKYENLAAAVHVLDNNQNLVISSYCFAKKACEIYRYL